MLLAAVPTATPPMRAGEQAGAANREIVQTYGRRSLFQPKARIINAVSDVSLTVRRGETLGIVGNPAPASRRWRVASRAVETDQRETIRSTTSTLRRSGRRNSAPYGGRCNSCSDPYRSLNPRRTVGKAIIEDR
jgi:peptide/nickel transport system ATP-binding protein